MVIELCIYSALPGKIEALIALLQEHIFPTRAQHGARLLFATVGDSGRLGEVVAAWAHDSETACATFDKSLQEDTTWGGMASNLGALMRTQSRQLLRTTTFTDVSMPPSGTRLIDLRVYSFKPGGLSSFLPVCASAGLPGQLRHCGDLVFHSISTSGPLDQLVQAWAYKDHSQYDHGQRSLFKDPEWARDYRQRVIHLVDEQEHRYLQTLSWSPTSTTT